MPKAYFPEICKKSESTVFIRYKLGEKKANCCCLIPVCLLRWMTDAGFKRESADPLLLLAPASLKVKYCLLLRFTKLEICLFHLQ